MTFVIDPDLLGLVDEVALVFGGGGTGMGRSHCVQLARAGCHVVVADIDPEGGARTVDEVGKVGRRAVFIQADARKQEDVKAAVQKAFDSFGKLNVGINHVGGGDGATPFLDYTEETWSEAIDLCLNTTFLCCQAEALAMIEHDIPGRIVNVGSSSGIVGAATMTSYGAAKAGVIHLTKSLGQELAAYNIRVNCIVPGTHMSELLKRILADPNTPAHTLEHYKGAAEGPPMGRIGEPWETAGLAVLFASKLTAYVTGQSLLSDGGLSLTTGRPPKGVGMVAQAVVAIGKS